MNIFLKHCYYNDYFKLVKLETSIFLNGSDITNRGTYYKLMHNNLNWKLNFYLKALENSQRKTLGWNPLVAKLYVFRLQPVVLS